MILNPKLGLKLRVQPYRGDRYRTAVAIVRRMINPLIIEGEMSGVPHRERIIRFDDLFRAGVRQTTVAHQNAESAAVQIPLARGG
jgi:hypothetical protein